MTEPWRNEEPNDETTYGLILPFVDESPSFCLGFEVGQLYERLKHELAAFTQQVHVENQRQLMMAAKEAGRRVSFEPLGESWTILHVEAK